MEQEISTNESGSLTSTQVKTPEENIPVQIRVTGALFYLLAKST